MRLLTPLFAAALLAGCTAPTSAPATVDTPATSASAAASSSAPATTSGTTTTAASPSGSNGTLLPLRQMMTKPQAPTMTKSDAGALMFSKYYIDVLDWARATRDDSGMDAVCGSSNQQCKTIRGWISNMVEQDGIQYGGRNYLSMDGVNSLSHKSDTVYAYRTTGNGDAGEVRTSDGTVLGPVQAFSTKVVLTMEWRDNAWVMVSANHA